MIEISLYISKNDVLKEVQLTTSYVGAKMQSDGSAWDRIRTINEDNSQLERFWNEATATVAEALRRFLKIEPIVNDVSVSFNLSVSSLFDGSLIPMMHKWLFSFYVQFMLSKWFSFVNRDEVTTYLEVATTYLQNIVNELYWKRRPTKPII